MDRLSMLAEEFRRYKVETDDRISRLEAAQSANAAPVPSSSPAPKKLAADAASTEKEAV